MTLVKLTKEAIRSVDSLTSDQDIIRSAIIAELDATSLYATQIQNLSNEKARIVLKHIMDEEKEHIAELLCVLFHLDDKQAEIVTEIPTDTCVKQ